ncbi:hypothetical protein N7475_009104 [Penicillium sp. IBT 31633x]|nr:hypothetical protein N7475_009104 [Penicillium sp. IBT 31633x]
MASSSRHRTTAPSTNARHRPITHPLKAPRHSPKIDLNTTICELVSYDGQRHPAYPHNLGEYYRLTSRKIDSLVSFFHQVHPPTYQTGLYPTKIHPWIGTGSETYVDLETKRRAFGTFIGFSENILHPGLGNPLRYVAEPGGFVINSSAVDAGRSDKKAKSKGIFGRLLRR